MNSKPRSCSSEWLAAFLKGKLSTQEEQALKNHLDGCEECCTQLERQAADEMSWEEASAFLHTPTLQAEGIGQSHHECSVESQHKTKAVVAELRPTDDPTMLGRLGSYEVRAVVGAGAMGVVLKAFDRSLDRTVAIKVLAPHLASSGAARQRFSREAKAAAAVLHPNVIATHSVSTDDSLPYLVMPYISGASLQKRIDSEGPLPLADTLRIASQIAAGLAAAHAQGLVHRDIKPANVMLEDGIERVAITDFGLARAVDDATMTRSGVIAGTPQFMSPEQAQGDAIDQRTDLFSLGSVLYAMSTGRAPFRAETTFGVLSRIVDTKPRSIREMNPEIPAWFEAIVLKLMAKQAEDRYGSAAEVAELLKACLAHVQQPTAVALPNTLSEPARSGNRNVGLASRFFVIGTTACLLGIPVLMSFLGFFDGTLIISCTDDDVPIQIKRGDELVRNLVMTKTGTSTIIRVPAGNYTISPTAEGLVVYPSTVSVRFMGTEDIHIYRGASHGQFEEELANAQPQKLLSAAVRDFNEFQRGHAIGKHQALLTDDEVVGSIRWATTHGLLTGLSSTETQRLNRVAESRRLPDGIRIVAVTELEGIDGERFQTWTVCLQWRRPDGARYRHRIRQRLLWQLDSEGREVKLGAGPRLTGDAQRALAQVIESYNESGQLPDDEAPLTEEEVVSVIKWLKSRRAELEVTQREFDQLQEIATQRVFPADAWLSVEPRVYTGEFLFHRSSINLNLGRLGEDGSYAHFKVTIRDRTLQSGPIDAASIRWGPVGINGLQAGVKLSPNNETYAIGQEINAEFFYRSASGKSLRGVVHDAFAYEQVAACDSVGQPLKVLERASAAGLGGVLQRVFGDKPIWLGQEPIAIVSPDRFDAELAENQDSESRPIMGWGTLIFVDEGTSCRIRFDVPNYADDGGSDLSTGELTFVVSGTVVGGDDRKVDLGPADAPQKTALSSSDAQSYPLQLTLIGQTKQGDRMRLRFAVQNMAQDTYRINMQTYESDLAPFEYIADAIIKTQESRTIDLEVGYSERWRVSLQGHREDASMTLGQGDIIGVYEFGR